MTEEARNLLVLHTPWGIEAASYRGDLEAGGEVARFDAEQPGATGQAEAIFGLMNWFKEICPAGEDIDGILTDGWEVRAVIVGLDRQGVLYEGDLFGYLHLLEARMEDLIVQIPGARMQKIRIDRGDGNGGASGQEEAPPEG